MILAIQLCLVGFLMDDDGLLCAQASDQKTLANNLNKMARMICFEGLHDALGVTKEIFGSDFFLY